MEKIPEIIQTLISISSCQFLSLESPQSEIDENQGRPTTQVFFISYTVYDDTGKFQTTNKKVQAGKDQEKAQSKNCFC